MIKTVIHANLMIHINKAITQLPKQMHPDAQNPLLAFQKKTFDSWKRTKYRMPIIQIPSCLQIMIMKVLIIHTE